MYKIPKIRHFFEMGIIMNDFVHIIIHVYKFMNVTK